MAGEALLGLGSIASEFAKGFREARGQRHQEDIQNRQEMEQHHERLLRMMEQVGRLRSIGCA